MKHYRIRISDKGQRGTALLEMAKLGRVVCLRPDHFIVPEPALTLLDNIGISYNLMGEEDPDSALRSARDSTATPL